MSKVSLTPRQTLELIRLGIMNGNLEAAVKIIDDVLEQLPPDTEFTYHREEEIRREDSDLLQW